MKAFYTKTQPKLNKKGIKEPSAPSKISSNWCYFWCFSFFFFKPILFSAASMKSGSLNALVKLDFIVLTYVHIYTCRLYICTYVCSRFHSNFTMFTFHFVCSLRFISLPSRTTRLSLTFTHHENVRLVSNSISLPPFTVLYYFVIRNRFRFAICVEMSEQQQGCFTNHRMCSLATYVILLYEPSYRKGYHMKQYKLRFQGEGTLMGSLCTKKLSIVSLLAVCI